MVPVVLQVLCKFILLVEQPGGTPPKLGLAQQRIHACPAIDVDHVVAVTQEICHGLPEAHRQANSSVSEKNAHLPELDHVRFPESELILSNCSYRPK